jgi:hypothetical protein
LANSLMELFNITNIILNLYRLEKNIYMGSI